MIASASLSLAGRLVIALLALTLFWAPLSHAGACDHAAEPAVGGVFAFEAVLEAAPAGDASDQAEAGHVCSCLGCHFHLLPQHGPRYGFAPLPGAPWADTAAQPAAASPGDLFRPPRV